MLFLASARPDGTGGCGVTQAPMNHWCGRASCGDAVRVYLRAADAHDGPALTEALVYSVNWDGRSRFTVEQVLARPHLAHYVTGWPRSGDVGVIAHGGDDSGPVIGSAWCRLFTATDPGYGYTADDVPELTLAVAPDHRGQGVGSALLTALVQAARMHGHPAVSLSVEDGNPARALYERAGFTVVGRAGDSDTMALDLRR